MRPVIKCAKCNYWREHKAKGMCLDCYSKKRSKEQYAKKRHLRVKYLDHTKIQLTCAHCKTTFSPKSKYGVNKDYCRPECRIKAQTARRTRKICEKCKELKYLQRGGLCKKCLPPKLGHCKDCKNETPKEIVALNRCSAHYHKYKRDQTLPDRDKQVTCPLCNEPFVRINESHLLKAHNVTSEQFWQKYPDFKISRVPMPIQKIIQEKGKQYWSKIVSESNRNRPPELKKYIGRNFYKRTLGKLPPEQRHEWHVQLGKISHQKNPELARNTAKKTLQSKKLIFCQKCGRFDAPNKHLCPKVTNPERYRHEISRAAKERHRKDPELAKRMGKRSFELHPNQVRENGLKSIKTLRNSRKENIWEGVGFDSNEELQIARMLVCKPIEGKNVHVQVKWCELDFLAEGTKGQVFVEYHPRVWLKRKGESEKQYMAVRLKAVKQSQYKGTRVHFIFDSLEKNKAQVLSQVERIKKVLNS